MKISIKTHLLLLVGILAGSYNAIQSEYSYMDTIKTTSNFAHIFGSGKDQLQQSLTTKTAVLFLGAKYKRMEHVLPLCNALDNEAIARLKKLGRISLLQGRQLRQNIPLHFDNNDTPIQKDTMPHYTKYVTWHNYDDNEDISDILFTAIAFHGSDFVVNKASECNVIENIAHTIPEEHRTFIVNNGKQIASSALTRTCQVIRKEGANGLNYINAKDFSQHTAKQIGCYTAEEYIVNPVANKIMGKETSLSKDIVSIALNYAAYYAINSAVGDIKKDMEWNRVMG